MFAEELKDMVVMCGAERVKVDINATKLVNIDWSNVHVGSNSNILCHGVYDASTHYIHIDIPVFSCDAATSYDNSLVSSTGYLKTIYSLHVAKANNIALIVPNLRPVS